MRVAGYLLAGAAAELALAVALGRILAGRRRAEVLPPRPTFAPPPPNVRLIQRDDERPAV